MGNFISVPVIKYDGVDYSKTESAGYKTVGLATDHVIYARDIETKIGSTASQTATGDKITITGHGLSVDDAIYFTAEIEPTNILANRVYYVQAVHDANTISVADAQGDGTAQAIAGNDTVAADVFKIEAEVIYADTCTNSRPIELLLKRGLIRQDHAGNTAQALSKQFFIIDCNKKNGVEFAGTDNNLVINTSRVILSYNTTSGGDDWNMFYDASKTNNAGFDSPFIHVLESETSINSAGVLEDFIQHIGALGGPENFESLTVNGNTVNFPDQSASGIVRLKNVINAYESGSKTYVKLKGMGKNSFDTLVINDTLANVVGSTDSTNIVD
tara:strand:+ start:17361 stop:18347 length:987 start_codon:yes stop_codon:yes gene_type:complete